ncbi:MAG TPA: MMPL family transporter [Actinomycetota bacterium]|nr:MMPL family transporter [Actinomycetota bacterium]
MRLNPESMARATSRHPWRTLGVWLVLIVAMGAVSSRLLGDVLSEDVEFTNRPESVRAQEVLEREFGAPPEDTEFFIVRSESLTVEDAAFEAVVAAVGRTAAEIGGDLLASPPATYYDLLERAPDQAGGFVSDDRHSALVMLELTEMDDETILALRETAEAATAGGFTVQLAGQGALGADMTTMAEEDLARGEMVGIGVALVVLIVVFAAVVAAVVPIVLALFAIVVALGLVALIGQLFEFNLFVSNMVTMIGLAVGIDYSLFIVSRYREERKKELAKLDAIAAAGATANRAVFFSGMTVVLALLGMLIVPLSVFRALAGGAILVTLASLAASMTLLPALLSLLGDRINWPRLAKRARVSSSHDPKGGVWDRMSRRVMARPVVFLAASVALLGGLGAFTFQLHKGAADGLDQLPDDLSSKRAFVALQRDFEGDRTVPASIVITGEVGSPEVSAAIERLEAAVAGHPSFAPQVVSTASPDGDTWVLDVYFRGDPTGDAAASGIRDLRSSIVPATFEGVGGVQVLVGGDPGMWVDFLDVADRYQVIVLVFVLGLSFVLLTAVFRSIVVPLKAIVMNLLSVGAAYGALVLVFQKGVGIDLLNSLGFQFHQAPAIEAWLPLMMFSVLFGLSMDYHVFLLTRIREEYDRTGDNAESVAYGLRTTAGIITGAALIMVAVFTGFAAGRLGPLQQMGFGLGVAVFLDATIVRSVLVPASMRLLGDRNWYLPRWLGWLPQVHVEGTHRVLEVHTEPVVLGEVEPVEIPARRGEG